MPRPNGPGRKTKLTPALQQAIATAVSGGVPFLRAAVLAGIDEITALEWLARGENRHSARKSTPLYAEFAKAIAQAKSQDEARRILRINQAGQGGAVVYTKTVETLGTDADGNPVVTRRVIEERKAPPDWAADAWHLERSRPDDWGRKDRVDLRLTIQKAAAKVAEEFGLSVDEVLAEAEGLLKAADRRG